MDACAGILSFASRYTLLCLLGGCTTLYSAHTQRRHPSELPGGVTSCMLGKQEEVTCIREKGPRPDDLLSIKDGHCEVMRDGFIGCNAAPLRVAITIANTRAHWHIRFRENSPCLDTRIVTILDYGIDPVLKLAGNTNRVVVLSNSELEQRIEFGCLNSSGAE